MRVIQREFFRVGRDREAMRRLRDRLDGLAPGNRAELVSAYAKSYLPAPGLYRKSWNFFVRYLPHLDQVGTLNGVMGQA
jgi:hypothetical protein